MSIRAIIFDVGGVLSRTEDFTLHRQWETRLGLSEGELAYHIFENEVARKATLGTATPDEVWQTVGQRLALSASDLEALQADFWKHSVWDADLLAFVRTLHPFYKTGILSDAWSNARAVIEPYVNYGTFDVIMFSAEEGLQKPDPALFHRLLTRLEVAPQEAVFIDDRAANVEGARQIGMYGLLFTDSEEVRAQITRLLES